MSSKYYFIYHKPYKVLSQFSDEDGNKGLGSLISVPKDVYPVGRLDLDSEGLLLLTNDNSINHRLLTPKYKHKRTYAVEVDGEVKNESLEKLMNGVEINLKGKLYRTQKCKARIITPSFPERHPSVNAIKHPTRSWIEITLTEGKNRQVRRMTAKIGHPTLRLIRTSIEDLTLGDLKSGELKKLNKNLIYNKLKISD